MARTQTPSVTEMGTLGETRISSPLAKRTNLVKYKKNHTLFLYFYFIL